MAFKIDTMVFTNPTKHTIKLEALGFDDVAPGADVELPLTVCAPYRMDNGNRGKSPVEQVAPQLEPKDPVIKAAWLSVPAPAIPQSKIVTNSPRHLQPQPEAPGVKALREKAEAAIAAKATRNATPSPQTNANTPGGKA